ncbi:Trm112 family protein [Rufibacter sp. XAAS-G3-1]|uniref:Trm112 family protein n=1 Tax=Rufibacter sp. XAAS-G3-1 TaxID=2729134 RepID=UPI0015E653AB|nr:Trm112 family protein [Rufibacter sp. XAAS-G3-1]
MKLETIEKLCCPFDKADIELTVITQSPTGTILEGLLACNTCARVYPIVKGIPIMNPDEYREYKLEQPLLDKWKPFLKGRQIENFRFLTPEKGNEPLALTS